MEYLTNKHGYLKLYSYIIMRVKWDVVQKHVEEDKNVVGENGVCLKKSIDRLSVMKKLRWGVDGFVCS